MTSFEPARFLDKKSQPHTFTLVVLASISAMAMNIFLPSLPSMADHFSTSTATLGLTVGIYLAASAVIGIFVGPISDLYGRRPVILVSLAVFIISSIWCIYASTVFWLLTARVFQACGAVTIVLSRAVIRDTTEANLAGSKIGYVTMGMALVPMVAPGIGGFIDAYLSWEYNFWALAIAGLITFILVFFDLGETAVNRSSSIFEQFNDYPTLLKSRRFWAYSITSGLGAGAFFAYLGGAPYVASEVFYLSPEKLGVFFGAPAIGYFVGNFLAGRFSTQVGIDPMISIGMFINVSGMLLSIAISMMGFGSEWSFFGTMTLVGLGNGISLPNANAGLLSINPKLAGTASGLGGSIMIGLGSILSAMAGILLAGSSTEIPLISLMLISAFLGLLCTFYVIKRNSELAS